MKAPRLVLSICTLAIGLALQSAAWGYSVTAATQFTWLNPSNNTGYGTAVPPSSLVPGASGAGSAYNGTFANSYSGFSWSAAAVQDYQVFYASASTQAHRDSPGNNFEVFQTFATGTIIQTLTIPAPVGVINGSTGQLMLGWNVTGSSSNGTSGFADLIMSARTSASLPNTSSSTGSIVTSGPYNLSSPISFTFGTAFDLTVDGRVFAAVGYDYRSSTPPSSFSDAAAAYFLNTVILSSVGVNDSAGNPLADFTIITDSGLPFLPAGAPVPVPSTLLLLGPALAGLVVMRRRFKE
jgi:hypothetical protein